MNPTKPTITYSKRKPNEENSKANDNESHDIDQNEFEVQDHGLDEGLRRLMGLDGIDDFGMSEGVENLEVNEFEEALHRAREHVTKESDEVLADLLKASHEEINQSANQVISNARINRLRGRAEILNFDSDNEDNNHKPGDVVKKSFVIDDISGDEMSSKEDYLNDFPITNELRFDVDAFIRPKDTENANLTSNIYDDDMITIRHPGAEKEGMLNFDSMDGPNSSTKKTKGGANKGGKRRGPPKKQIEEIQRITDDLQRNAPIQFSSQLIPDQNQAHKDISVAGFLAKFQKKKEARIQDYQEMQQQLALKRSQEEERKHNERLRQLQDVKLGRGPLWEQLRQLRISEDTKNRISSKISLDLNKNSFKSQQHTDNKLPKKNPNMTHFELNQVLLEKIAKHSKLKKDQMLKQYEEAKQKEKKEEEQEEREMEIVDNNHKYDKEQSGHETDESSDNDNINSISSEDNKAQDSQKHLLQDPKTQPTTTIQSNSTNISSIVSSFFKPKFNPKINNTNNEDNEQISTLPTNINEVPIEQRFNRVGIKGIESLNDESLLLDDRMPLNNFKIDNLFDDTEIFDNINDDDEEDIVINYQRKRYEEKEDEVILEEEANLSKPLKRLIRKDEKNLIQNIQMKQSLTDEIFNPFVEVEADEEDEFGEIKSQYSDEDEDNEGANEDMLSLVEEDIEEDIDALRRLRLEHNKEDEIKGYKILTRKNKNKKMILNDDELDFNDKIVRRYRNKMGLNNENQNQNDELSILPSKSNTLVTMKPSNHQVRTINELTKSISKMKIKTKNHLTQPIQARHATNNLISAYLEKDPLQSMLLRVNSQFHPKSSLNSLTSMKDKTKSLDTIEQIQTSLNSNQVNYAKLRNNNFINLNINSKSNLMINSTKIEIEKSMTLLPSTSSQVPNSRLKKETFERFRQSFISGPPKDQITFLSKTNIRRSNYMPFVKLQKRNLEQDDKLVIEKLDEEKPPYKKRS